MNTRRVDASVLTGVSETALLTLRARANEARRPDAIIDDPVAIEPDGRHRFRLRQVRSGTPSGHGLARTWPSTRVAKRYLGDSSVRDGGRAGRRPADQLLAARRRRRRPRIPLADSRSAADRSSCAERLLPSSPRISIRAQSALDYSVDGRRRYDAGRVHHRRGIADVPAAGAVARVDHRVRATVPGCSDDVRPAAAMGGDLHPPRVPCVVALPGAGDAVLVVDDRDRGPRQDRARNPRSPRHPVASAAAGRFST